jgi:hypothetical protein
MEWLMRLLKLQPQDLPATEEVRATVAALSEPANAAWIMARIAALLNPYYDKDTPPAVRRMEAEDWLEALAEYPQWAIERAVRWWKSADNEARRKKPLEGDIAARCRVELRGIGALPEIVRRKRSGAWHDTPQIPAMREKPDPAKVDELLASAGFRPRRMEAQADDLPLP